MIDEIHERLGPEDAIRHVTRKPLNNRTESDHAALMRLLRPMRGIPDLSSAKTTLEAIAAFRAIRKAESDGATRGVAKDIAFVADLIQDAA